jgi:nicotinate phosphoribosyltransferase
MRAGVRVDASPPLQTARRRLADSLVTLPWEGLKLSHGDPAIPTTVLTAQPIRR